MVLSGLEFSFWFQPSITTYLMMISWFFFFSFNSVCQGTHILFREFSFIQATPHNRASFLRAFWRCFRTVGKNGGKSSHNSFLAFFLPHFCFSLIPVNIVECMLFKAVDTPHFCREILPPVLPPSLLSAFRARQSSEHFTCSNSLTLHCIPLW